MTSIENILPAIVDTQTKVLIVGSMPGVQSLQKQQYYGNPQNHFWPIIGDLLKKEIPQDYKQRIELLKVHHIGLWDVIHSCEREGSLDAKIKNEIPNDFEALFTTFPHIELVLFNGAKAYDVFRKKVGLEILGSKKFEKMPSTSPIPGKNIKTYDQKVETWKVLLNYIK